MIKIAMLSFWHVHAKDYARQATEHPDTEIAAVWDENSERGKTKAEELGVPFYENLQELLAQSEIDAVIVDAPTNTHRDVIMAAAKSGKHIFTEKVLATTSQECNEILAAVQVADVKLMVSLPRLYASFTQAVQQIIREGLLGELTQVRIRLAHKGALPADDGLPRLPDHFFSLEQCGGGAMIDLGCHPMYLTLLFLGMPESVSSSYGYVTGREVEDNGVAILRYPNGALGIVEAGFVNRFSPFVIEAHGTEGSLIYSAQNGKVVLASSKLGGNPIQEWPMPASLPSAIEQWVSHIRGGTIASENIQLALDLTVLMEASNLSARTGAAVRLEH